MPAALMISLKAPSVLRILPFGLYILFLMSDQMLAGVANNMGADARWLYPVRILVVSAMLAYCWRQYTELAGPLSAARRFFPFSTLVGVCVFVIWVMPYPGWAQLGEAGSGFDPRHADGSIDLTLAAIRFLGAALVVPVMEELFWRSFFMRWLDRTDFLLADPARTTHRAFFITSALFAVEHRLWLAGLIAGIAYGWLYKVSRNLWAPVLAHAVTNGLLAAWVLYRGAWEYW